MLKPPKNTGQANKSAKHIKNSVKHIFGGLKKPIDDKKYRAKNNILKPKKTHLTGLLSGFDAKFESETDFKNWLNGFKNCFFKPVNCRHNLAQKYKRPPYQGHYIARFDIAVKDTTF